MTGGLTRGLEINTFDIVSELALRLNSQSAGVVGDIIGQFIDRRGRPLDHALNCRAIALPLRDLSHVPTVVVAAGGRHKVQAITAVLRGRLGSVFVCDESTARAAMTLARSRA